MKKILIKRNQDIILIDPNDLTSGLCYIDGEIDDDLYRYNAETDEMEPIVGEYLSKGSETIYQECPEEEADMTVDENHYKDVSNDLCYCCVLCSLEHGIRVEEFPVELYDGRIYDMTEVDVDVIGSIPAAYPNQQLVTIYEGVDDSGKKIQICETSPFFADDSCPTCEVLYI